MKPILSLPAAALLLALTPTPSFALWDVLVVSKQQAKELGFELRATHGKKYTQVALEFSTDGKLKDFTQINMKLGKGDDLVVSAPLREDRSKPGRVVAGVTLGHTQLDKLIFTVMVPYRDGALGGVAYELPVKHLVDVKKTP